MSTTTKAQLPSTRSKLPSSPPPPQKSGLAPALRPGPSSPNLMALHAAYGNGAVARAFSPRRASPPPVRPESRALSPQPSAGSSSPAAEAGPLQLTPATDRQPEAAHAPAPPRTRSTPPNTTGLPDGLKSGIEALSGISMDGVNVDYNSPQPAQLNALAYAQGRDIHVAPGQERHLPHEAWHVVQQAQGRVKPTMQMKDGVPVNDDKGLEHEADVMGARASAPAAQFQGGPGECELLQRKFAPAQRTLGNQPVIQSAISPAVVVQRILDAGKVRSTIENVQGALKQPRAVLLTDVAQGQGFSEEDAKRLVGVIDHVHASLGAYHEHKNITESMPHLMPLVEDEAIYIQGETLYLNPEFLDWSLADQTSELIKLLASDEPLVDQLAAFCANVHNKPKETLPKDKSELTLHASTKLYRVVKADSARNYLASGINRVSNREGWTELGKGFYTSPDREGAESYAPTVGKPAVLLELTLDMDAHGKTFFKTAELDGKSEEYIKQKFGQFLDFVCDQHYSQIKFHNPFYRDHLTISGVWVTGEREQWIAYDPPASFITAYESHIVKRHKEKAAEIPLPPEKAKAPTNIREIDKPSKALSTATDVPAVIIDAIHYAEAAQVFEKKLGEYLSTYGPALTEVGKVVAAAWRAVPPERQSKFGTKQRTVTGMVGDLIKDLQAVVDTGNLRECFTFLYNGYTGNLFGRLKRPQAFEEERRPRTEIPKEQVGEQDRPDPFQVTPPLSGREWFSSVDPKGKLGWIPGEKLHTFKMSTKFQADAEDFLTPVSAGTSGTAFGILEFIKEIDQKSGKNSNLPLIRLGLLGWMIPAGDHTFHEIMKACQMYSDTLAYEPNLQRYRNIPPLTEEFLREQIATNRLFPDEVPNEERTFGLLLEVAKLVANKQDVGAGHLYQDCAESFPKNTMDTALARD